MDNIEKLKEERKRIGSWGRIVPARLDAVKKYAGKRVLDIGCSSGEYVFYLRKLGYEAYGLDVMPHEKWDQAGGEWFSLGDVAVLPYKDKAFDTIVAFEVLEHLEEVHTALSEMKRVARKNIIISVPNCLQPPVFEQSRLAFHHWVDRTHKHFFDENSLRKMLEQHSFKVEYFKGISPVIPEVLALSVWNVPDRICGAVARVLDKIGFRKKYYMSLLVVASVE